MTLHQDDELRELPGEPEPTDNETGSQLATRSATLEEYTLPRPSLMMIEHSKHDLAILQQLVVEVLTPVYDWGKIPGVPAPCLFDPGAAKIFAAFNVYPGERRILKLEDDETRIVCVVEVPIIDRKLGKVVATGIGAASTLEIKHKYRWIDDPKAWGLDDFTIASLKTKQDNGRTLYRVPNQEYSELLNTIIKMASKRAEVDAAESMPGVATVLRQLFQPDKHASGAGVDMWGSFWGEIRRLGVTQDTIHAKYGSIKLYVEKSGKPAAEVLKQIIEELRKSTPTPSSPTESKKTGAQLTAVQQLWLDARKELEANTAITAEMVANWWGANKSVVVTLEDFKKDEPPQTFPRDAEGALRTFIKAVRSYKAQAKQGQQ